MSRLLNRQRQLAEAGRLRLGWTEPTSNGKVRPVRSETWVLTSHSQEIVDAAAALWGGSVERWQPQGNGAQQWRVITTTSSIDAILPPGDPLNQTNEQWSRGGCVRRCDGVTEQLTGSPCVCIAEFGDQWYEQPAGRVCSAKSRLNVLLPDLPGLGSYRMETGSYYATDEIAGMVDLIRGAVGDRELVPIRLRIEPRTRVANGQTKQFVVPVVELRGRTTGQILGAQMGGAVESAPTTAPALTAGDPRADADTEALVNRIADATTRDEVTAIWAVAKATPGVEAGTIEAAARLRVAALDNPAAAIAVVNETVDADAVWTRILTEAGKRGLSTDDVRDDYARRNGGQLIADASAEQMTTYLAAFGAETVGKS